MTKRFIINALVLAFRILTRIKIDGLDNVPASGKCILAINHVGIIDGPLLIYLQEKLPRDDFILIVAEKYQQNFIIKWAVNNLGYLFIDRFNIDLLVMKIILSRLRDGGVLVMAPEGTRSDSGGIENPRSGAAYMSAKTQSPIVPIGFTGTDDDKVWPTWLKFRRLTLGINIGTPFQIPELPAKNQSEFLKNNTDEVMCQIASLLPENYQGEYKDHPRLLELAKS